MWSIPPCRKQVSCPVRWRPLGYSMYWNMSRTTNVSCACARIDRARGQALSHGACPSLTLVCRGCRGCHYRRYTLNALCNSSPRRVSTSNTRPIFSCCCRFPFFSSFSAKPPEPAHPTKSRSKSWRAFAAARSVGACTFGGLWPRLRFFAPVDGWPFAAAASSSRNR